MVAGEEIVCRRELSLSRKFPLLKLPLPRIESPCWLLILNVVLKSQLKRRSLLFEREEWRYLFIMSRSSGNPAVSCSFRSVGLPGLVLKLAVASDMSALLS